VTKALNYGVEVRSFTPERKLAGRATALRLGVKKSPNRSPLLQAADQKRRRGGQTKGDISWEGGQSGASMGGGSEKTFCAEPTSEWSSERASGT